MIEHLQPFAISFFIGLLIGIERERSHPSGLQAMGVRTFVLLSLLGTLAATIKDPIISIVISIFAFCAILLGYWRSSAVKDKETAFGLTTEFSAGAVFCLGFITLQEPLLAALVGMTVLFVLLSRERLHRFSRQHLKPQEIRAATTMLVILLGILPFLPNRTIDAWQLFNPLRFGFLVVAIAAIQFGGYVAMRVLGERLGLLLTGFFGGLVSSTVVFINLPHTLRLHPEHMRAAVAAAMLATVAMLIEFMVDIFIAAPQLLSTVFRPIIAMIIAGLLAALLMTYNNGKGKAALEEQEHGNPLDVKSVLRLAIFIGGMVFIIGVAQLYLGTKGIQAIAFLGGLFELHGVTYATATLNTTGKLAVSATCLILATALLASFVTKFALLWSLARDRFAVITSLFLILMAAVGGVTYFYIM